METPSFQNDVYSSDHPERYIPRSDYDSPKQGREVNANYQHEDVAEALLGKIPANLPRGKELAQQGIPTQEERTKIKHETNTRSGNKYKDHGVSNRHKKVIY